MQTTPRIGTLVAALSLALGSNAGHAGNLPVTSCLDDFGAGTLRLVMFGAANGDIVDLSQLSCADSKITLAHGAISSSAPNLSVIGPGQQALTIDGAGLSRVLVNTALQGTFSISGLTIANGHFHHSGGTALGGCIYGRYRVALDHVTVDSCTIDGAVDADVVAGAGVAALGGPLSLTASTISNCSAAQGTTIAGVGAFGYFGMSVVDSTITGNTGTASAHAIGGCLATFHNASQLQVTRSTVTGCTLITNGGAGNYAKGGGIGAAGGLTVTSSVISGNTVTSSEAHGGGMFAAGNATFDGASIHDNQSNELPGGSAFGGGIDVGGIGQINYSTIDHNHSRLGGGVNASASSLTIVNSTISSNTALLVCGGLYAKSTLSLMNSTVAFNVGASAGGGICPGTGAMSSQSSIVAKNTKNGGAATDIDIGVNAIVVSGSYNLIPVRVGVTLPGDTLHDDPLLLPLANNGGSTRTHALDPTSPAIDKGANPTNLISDQRHAGFLRAFGAHADIGAFESQPFDRIFAGDFEP